MYIVVKDFENVPLRELTVKFEIETWTCAKNHQHAVFSLAKKGTSHLKIPTGHSHWGDCEKFTCIYGA